MSKSKQKGTAAETAVVNYLREHGWVFAERRALQGARDTGDVNLGPGAPVIEIKNHKTMTLAQYMDEVAVETANAKAPFGVAWHKRVGKGSPGEWYVTMTGSTFVHVLKDLGY